MQELELRQDIDSLDRLLDFLACSFMGGTDVDKPLYLSLDRLKQQEWAQVGGTAGGTGAGTRGAVQAGRCRRRYEEWAQVGGTGGDTGGGTNAIRRMHTAGTLPEHAQAAE